MRRLFVALGVLTAMAQQPPAPPPSNPGETRPTPVYVPERVYYSGLQSFLDFESMLATLTDVDVVLVGEQHDDPNTHRLEAAMLEGLARRKASVTVSLEMFERDVQPLVDRYLAGAITEEEFLAGSRPWPRYATDYRPLVEIARANSWPVIASNVPRKYASAVAKEGLSVLESLPPAERALVARDVECPFDTYFDRFAETMNSHPMPGTETQSAEERRAMNERYYFAQCVKDETMAESIARVVEPRARRSGPAVHYNGAFHSDFGAGVAERLRRRLPGRLIMVISMLPVEDIDAVTPARGEFKRADYLVYTVR